MGVWNTADHRGWQMRRDREAGLPQGGTRFTAPDLGIAIIALVIKWELCVAFLALKLWQQASGHRGSVFVFAREKWEALVAFTRSVTSGSALPSMSFGVRSSGNHAFDDWRRTELERIEAERAKLRAAEREFNAYRDELLHANDRADFERFMRARGGA